MKARKISGREFHRPYETTGHVTSAPGFKT
jgi:hypothetical protein